jgi:hypothetical protein
MGYYQGDYYAGARGDPGLRSFFGKVLGTFGGAVPIVGPALSKIGGLISGGARPAAAGLAATGGIVGAGRAIMARGKMAIIKHPVLSAAGAAGAVGAMVGAGAESMMMGGGACPKGYHISKSRHSKSFGACVRNRKMNPCNPRALRRAVRRATRFTRLAMKTIHLVHPKKKGRFGGFKKRRRAA